MNEKILEILVHYFSQKHWQIKTKELHQKLDDETDFYELDEFVRNKYFDEAWNIAWSIKTK
jgi:hypothetical protein